jgi:hypothetical protein
MEYLTPTELRTSVQKFFDKSGNIIDISIDNINPNFYIDNYKSENILRNSDFRSEFNSLCKGKTETKNLEEKPKIDNKKIYLCKEDQIRDIPPILEPLFSKPNNYYIYGTPGKVSFYYSILNIVDSEFILKGSIHKEKMIDDCRNKLVYELDELYKKFNYKKKKFRKNAIRENLLNSKCFIPQVNTYIADYYNLCLVIIDTETYLYSLANDFSKEKDFIVMIRKNNYYQPILGVDGKHKFTWKIMEKISTILKPEFEIDMNLQYSSIDTSSIDTSSIDTSSIVTSSIDTSSIVTSSIDTSSIVTKTEIINTEETIWAPKKLEKLWKYKLSDLHDIAKTLNIDIKSGNRNKKKEDLYSEIESKLEE